MKGIAEVQDWRSLPLLVLFAVSLQLVGPSHVEANIEGVPITNLVKVADLIAVVEIGETKALAGARTSRGLVPEITMARMKLVKTLKCPKNIRPLISTSNGMMATSVNFPETSAGGIKLRSGKFLAFFELELDRTGRYGPPIYAVTISFADTLIPVENDQVEWLFHDEFPDRSPPKSNLIEVEKAVARINEILAEHPNETSEAKN